MKLSNDFIVVSPYKGKSKFDFWKQIQPQDILNISFAVESYSSLVIFKCDKYKDNTFACSVGQAANYLRQIELKEINNAKN